MPRFVLLHHECPVGFSRPSHCDLMFEVAGVLETWELRILPASWSELLKISVTEQHTTVPTNRLADHRLDYLHYEGPLSHNRGTVTRLAAGTYQLLSHTADLRQMRLHGRPLHGLCHWARTDSGWQLTAHSTSPRT